MEVILAEVREPSRWYLLTSELSADGGHKDFAGFTFLPEYFTLTLIRQLDQRISYLRCLYVLVLLSSSRVFPRLLATALCVTRHSVIVQ